MDVFEFRGKLVADYETFTRSFTRIRASDIEAFVDAAYDSGRYWPAPLVQVNPNFKTGQTVESLAASGKLHAECAGIFRAGKSAVSPGTSLTLFRHQEEAIGLAQRGESYVLTTGTGSGKSLSYFIPMVDGILKAKAVDGTPRTRAIVIYPMNALANSQMEELGKFLSDFGDRPPVTFGRYTGQEDDEERQKLASNPPDILLTNFMMLELLMTRQDDKDKAVIRNAHGLRFLVLDELHTYRGRQGADVALLVRRVREALSDDLQCIGTSATMATEGTEQQKNEKVAEVASRLFGTHIGAANIITETLQRVTPEHLLVDHIKADLGNAIRAGLPANPTFTALASHPLAVWVELNLGLTRDEGKWRRASPSTLEDASKQLAADADVPLDLARATLTEFLLLAYRTTDKPVNEGGRSLFAFKLHQFISGGSKVFGTLEPTGKRYLTLDGSQFVPGERHRRLFALHFCRECGQEYVPVWDESASVGRVFNPRSIDERTHDDEDIKSGYFMPDTTGIWDDTLDRYPESWVEQKKDGDLKLKSTYKRRQPQHVRVDTEGHLTPDGTSGWYIPGSFGFCLSCGVVHQTAGKESLRLTGLSGEGRSSATTMLTLSALRYLYEEDAHLKDEAKKVLGFTDNRQDAALQVGHFNDFLQVLLQRAALLSSIEKSGGQLDEAAVSHAVFAALGFDRDDPGVRAEYMQEPDLKGNPRRSVQDVMRAMLGYRVFVDLRRGWRFNNPNLEQLGLVRIEYLDIDELAADESAWVKAEAPQVLLEASPAVRKRLLIRLFDTMRQGLCLSSRYLDPTELDKVNTASFKALREPWGFTENEAPVTASWFITTGKPRDEDPRNVEYLVSGSARSRLGKEIKQASMWRETDAQGNKFDSKHATKLKDDDYQLIVTALLKAAEKGGYGQVISEETEFGMIGYQLNSSSLVWKLGDGVSGRSSDDNAFFRSLYANIAGLLGNPVHRLFDFEAREHTAQVEQDDRLEREARFRFTQKDRDDWLRSKGTPLEWLPVLFCSPTMELGVDISSLNTVYMRNVPPTPANYAQRSGRAGRAGQPALVITYCAAQSPHDQYFFREPVRMVHGQVNPPALDLANRELIESHLHAIWLAETGKKLDKSVRGLLDMNDAAAPLTDDYRQVMDADAPQKRAHRRGLRVLGMLSTELTNDKAPWFTENFADQVFRGAFASFDKALNRWRDLFAATKRQMEFNQAVMNQPSASERERRDAKQRHDEAFRQQSLLLQESGSSNSDFYTYRYLASQGFLPGYNFPRLPLMAYIPARKGKIGRENFLSRPRFLALSEFGPYSIIYHEGSQYRVTRAMLSVAAEDQVSVGALLTTEVARVCPACGYGHFRGQRDADRCLSCNSLLPDAEVVQNLYRIENVSTRRADRITANEEERVRQGYEMQTTLQFVEEDGRLQVRHAVMEDANGVVLELQYGASATVWRMNLGWRRRKKKSLFGFKINPVTGHWMGGADEAGEPEPDTAADKTPPQRIVPYVEDRRNVLIVRPQEELDLKTMATLQYALKRGIEAVYQLEESELMVEPLPKADLRRSILLYESAEGGAGVLTRIATEPGALARVAAEALRIMHYIPPVDGNWQAASLAQEEIEGKPVCEAGCYRCLLSYYNQPDHVNIDRQDLDNDGKALDILCRLTHCQGSVGSFGRTPDAQMGELQRISGSSLEQAWLEYVQAHGYRMPDRGQESIARCNTMADFFYEDWKGAVFIDGPHHETPKQMEADAAINRCLDGAGYYVVRFPKDTTSWPEIFAAHADLFGTGNHTQ
ncbi:helicase superfamily protein [Burkholderia pseudomallei]|uniref:DEAD/DEAH box helicase n=1 Tax=Burkholderia pseudomallei TaxID=28450 RepID=UPI00025C3374|nr:DEAD/DEAH box helicase [Burkholderia pseudomallei]ARL49461.1 DEAD/DEAH box helicase [Burkholderia pseudomallei]EIF70914.1 helicase family protein [Burkholderia pseudomallei 354e]MBF3557419.1 DEAD/DEAH box helicase [Burkholderia pseudomallei]MDY7816311.1 DEAD/DEAH box helicase [Burkholderia pseudomallei]MDY7863028.1 DEAD/DEAH box helicase [Burkholderia pseudomallei]